MTAVTRPLLTVAIPTYNRAGYLATNLAQLRSEIATVDSSLVEIIVSDNCSADATPQVVRDAQAAGLAIRSVRNERNIGWALNFAQCFDLATAKYVLMIGDDDLFVDGALALLLDRLSMADYGVVCLKPYGYDVEFRSEFPGGTGRELVFDDANAFLIAIGSLMTLTSSCVLNKSLLPGVDSREFSNGDLGTLHLVLRAALAGRRNLYFDRYLIAGKRQNSFNYEYAEVFVGEWFRIVDAQIPHGLKPATIRRIEHDLLRSYYPFYMLDLRLTNRGSLAITEQEFSRRFGRHPLYRYWVAPIVRWPRPAAIAWGFFTTVAGRLMAGELRRGLTFVAARVRRRLPFLNQQTTRSS